jgi:hypothetical protein
MKIEKLLDKGHKKLFDFKPFEDSSKYQTVKIRDTTIILQIKGRFHNPDGIVNLVSLRTPLAKRGNGSARHALEILTAQADSEGVTIKLDASPLDKKTKLQSLVDFYKSNGFIETGYSNNQAREPEMIRHPKVS